MPTRAIFERYSTDDVRGALREAKKQARRETREDYMRAVDFVEGRQLDHVAEELTRRMADRQINSAGQEIRPITIPLTQRYVAEAATLYNHKVTREVVNEDGSVNEEMTETLNKQLDLIGYDERLHRVEELQEVVNDVGLWFQIKAGRLRPVVTLPHDIYPVAPSDGSVCDPTDQRDYIGYVVQVVFDVADLSASGKAFYAFLTPAETIYYEGRKNEPFDPASELNYYQNILQWDQVIDTPDQRGTTVKLPLQPLTLWHKRIPVDSVLSFPDPDIVNANLELNVQWSVLLDALRTQGWATPVLNVMNPDQMSQQVIPYGANMPVVLETGEAFAFAGSPAPFESWINGLRTFIETIAIAHRQSPNDFSTEGAAPASGFAKIIDSLPKLEARRERAARFKYSEEQHAWPRIAAAGVFLGWDGFTEQSVKNATLRVQFGDIEFPRTVDEEIRRAEFDLKNGLTTKAKLLAKKLQITEQEAEEKLAEQNEKDPPTDETEQQPPGPPMQPQRSGLLGLIAQRKPLTK